jgi:chromate transporter
MDASHRKPTTMRTEAGPAGFRPAAGWHDSVTGGRYAPPKRRSGVSEGDSRTASDVAGPGSVREVAAVFLKLGITGFGGPAAHVAMMEDEVVRRRGWVSRERFLDLLGATNLIPGPNSTEMAIHLGHLRAGWPGLLVAGVSFILPAFLVVLGCAWAYVRFGARPAAAGLLYGVKPVIIAVVIQALWGLGRAATRTRAIAGVGLLSLAAVAAGAHELVVLFLAGAVLALARSAREAGGRGLSGLLPLLPFAGGAAGGVVPFGLLPLFLFFLKVGSVLYGSGYVLLAFLRADLVARRGWLTEDQLLDAVAVGQVTPGPVFTTATFVGYVLGGTPGAVVATIGIFLPAFVFVALSGPLVPWIRRTPVAGAFLDGVNAGSIALMALVSAQLARAAVVDLPTAAIAVASAVLLLRFRASPAWLVPAGGAAGFVLA